MILIRKILEADLGATLAIVNDAAQAYRGVIPADRWREPYMPPDELEKEIADGVVFWVAEEDGRLSGVMGIQDKGEVALVRHASPCGRPRWQARLDRYLGGCVLGHRVLSAKRIHRRPEPPQRSPAPDLLVDPGETDRNVGGPRRSTMDGGPTARFSGRLIATSGFNRYGANQIWTCSQSRLLLFVRTPRLRFPVLIDAECSCWMLERSRLSDTEFLRGDAGRAVARGEAGAGRRRLAHAARRADDREPRAAPR